MCGPAAAQDLASTLPVVVTTGDAMLQRAPDRAFVTAAVEARAKSPRDAQRQAADAMAAVRQRLAAAQIPSASIRTVAYDLEQEFDYVQGKRIPRDFLARNAIEIRIDDLAILGATMDAVVQAGATSVSNVRFDLQDRSAVEREALRMAVADARARADAAAHGAGQAIDRIIKIEDQRESRNEPPRPMFAAARADQAAPSTPVEPGVIDIHARVTLTASMK
jgi:uncharacterized protein YggE